MCCAGFIWGRSISGFGPARIRRRERKTQGFKSPGSAQRFLSIHASIYNNFNTGRHLISAATHRQLRNEAFAAWRRASDAAA
jgi:putative transposase